MACDQSRDPNKKSHKKWSAINKNVKNINKIKRMRGKKAKVLSPWPFIGLSRNEGPKLEL